MKSIHASIDALKFGSTKTSLEFPKIVSFRDTKDHEASHDIVPFQLNSIKNT